MPLPDVDYKRLIVVDASSKLGLEELLEKFPKLIGKGAIQAFDKQAIASKEHLYWAYLNALISFSNKTNRAKSLPMEMLLFAALTSQIGDAIKRVGAKSNSDFVVFCSDKKAYSKISKYLDKTSNFSPSKESARKKIVKLGVKSGKFEDLVQEMALSGLPH